MTTFKDEIDVEAFELDNYPTYCELCTSELRETWCVECQWYLRWSKQREVKSNA